MPLKNKELLSDLKVERSLVIPGVEDKVQLSSIVSNDQFATIWNWLPVRYKITEPKLLYSSPVHGFNLTTLLQNTKEREPILMIIKSKDQNVKWTCGGSCCFFLGFWGVCVV
jgi:hypothetical protein